MKQQRQAVVCTDDQGREMHLDIIDRFDHRGVEYALLMDMAGSADCSSEREIYVMRVLYDGEAEEYVPLSPAVQEEIMPLVWVRLTGLEALRKGADTTRLS